MLKKRYFFQLQDAAQSLWFRLDNLAHRRGRNVMEDDYFATTTLYALGRVFAIERIFAVEGIYSELERLYPGLGDFLMANSLNRNFRAGYEYHRLALAEAIMERDDEGFRVSTFVEFRERYQGSTNEERTWLEPALHAIKQIDVPTIESAMVSLKEVALRMSKETRMVSTLENASQL